MLKLRELQEVSGETQEANPNPNNNPNPNPDQVSGETQEALLFLAYYCKDTGELQEAQQHCSRLLDIGGQVRV